MITIPQVSIARELWRYGEQDLAQKAMTLCAEEAADIGACWWLHQLRVATRVWPNGPSGVTPAILLAAIEFLEGKMRPASRVRRLPERSLPVEMQLSEEERWRAIEPASDEMTARLHRQPPT